MDAPREYRKKPVVIQAIRWTGSNLREVIAFTGKHPRWGEWFATWEEYETRVRADGNIVKILTLEGTMHASPGDWIIRGVRGEHYPCKPDIFEATNEPADLAPGAQPAESSAQERRLADALLASVTGMRLDEHDSTTFRAIVEEARKILKGGEAGGSSRAVLASPEAPPELDGDGINGNAVAIHGGYEHFYDEPASPLWTGGDEE